MNNKLYEMYSGHELQVAELIQRRRLQLLVHSCLYYEMNTNLVTDRQWDIWAKELVQLQKQYPRISENVIWHSAFKDWDASTGAFLPLKDLWVIRKAQQLGGRTVNLTKTKQSVPTTISTPTKPSKNQVKTKKRLF